MYLCVVWCLLLEGIDDSTLEGAPLDGQGNRELVLLLCTVMYSVTKRMPASGEVIKRVTKRMP